MGWKGNNEMGQGDDDRTGPTHRSLDPSELDLASALEAGLVYLNGARQEENRFPLSGSTAAQCPRATHTLIGGAQRTPITARQAMIFEIGHAIEQIVVRAIEAHVGPQNCERQVAVWAPVHVSTGKRAALVERLSDHHSNLHPMQGHPSVGIMLVNGSTVPAIRSRIDLLVHGWMAIDVKSMKDYAFKKFAETGELGESYATQFHLQLLGLPSGCKHYVVAVNKGSGETHCREFLPEAHRSDIQKGLSNLHATLDAWLLGKESLAIYAEKLVSSKRKGAAGSLPWQCTYCPIGPIIGGCVPEHRLEAYPKTDGSGLIAWDVTH